MQAKQGRLRSNSRGTQVGTPVASLGNPAKPLPKPSVKPRTLAPAPPPAPAAGPPPATSDSATIRANAQQALTGAQTGYRDSAFRAAMALGDPAAWAKMQADPQFAGYQFTQDPNSLFSMLARDETEGLQGLDEESNQRNAFFSGFRLDDRNQFSTGIQEQRAQGARDFDEQLAELARILAGAQGQYNIDIGEADRIDREAAEANAPEAAAGLSPSGLPIAPGPPVAVGSKQQAPSAREQSRRQQERARQEAEEAERRARRRRRR